MVIKGTDVMADLAVVIKLIWQILTKALLMLLRLLIG